MTADERRQLFRQITLCRNAVIDWDIAVDDARAAYDAAVRDLARAVVHLQHLIDLARETDPRTERLC